MSGKDGSTGSRAAVKSKSPVEVRPDESRVSPSDCGASGFGEAPSSRRRGSIVLFSDGVCDILLDDGR